MTLEIIERLAAAPAAPQRLAGGRAEFGQQFGILRAALRTRHLLLAEQRAAELRPAAARCRIPGACCGRPRSSSRWSRPATARCERRPGDAGAFQRQLDFQRDHVHGRTAGIGRRDRDLDAAVMDPDVAQHAEIGDGQHGISGSTTCAAASQARRRRSVSLRTAATMSPPERSAASTAVR